MSKSWMRWFSGWLERAGSVEVGATQQGKWEVRSGKMQRLNRRAAADSQASGQKTGSSGSDGVDLAMCAVFIQPSHVHRSSLSYRVSHPLLSQQPYQNRVNNSISQH